MIVVVASSETNAVCLRSLYGEGSDGSGEPEGLAVENNGGIVDSCRAEDSLILAYRILYCALDVGHLHRGGIHGELTRGARLNGCTACVLCGGGFGDEGESGSALGRLRGGICCVFETGAMIAGKKLVQRTAESSAEREGHGHFLAGRRFSIDHLDFTRLLKSVCLCRRASNAKHRIDGSFTLDLSFVHLLGEDVLIADEARDGCAIPFSIHLNLKVVTDRG